ARRRLPRGAPMPFSLAPAEVEPPEAEPVPLHEAYRTCEEIARAHYENFPVASRFLPTDRRIALAAIYAFARQADDIADAQAPSEDRLRALDAIEAALLRAVDGAPQGAIFTALADAVERHRLPVEPFLDLLHAFRMDARDATFPTWDDLLAYCRGSANPVGRLVLSIHLRATIAGGLAILRATERLGWRVLERRPKLSGPARAGIAIRALIGLDG